MSLSPSEGLAVGHGLASRPLSILVTSVTEILAAIGIKISVCGGAAGSLCVVTQDGWAERRLVLTDVGRTKK